MAAPFQPQPVPARSLLDRVFRRPPSVATAEAEVANFFASARAVRQVNHTHFRSIEERYGFDPRFALVTTLESIFRRYLAHCVADQHMSDDEVADLIHLKQLFAMPDAIARQIHDEVAAPHYRDALSDQLAGGPLSAAATAFLAGLRDRLLLSDRYAERLRVEAAGAVVLAAKQRATEDQRLSPAEAAELIALASSLGVEWPVADSDVAVLDRLRLYWGIENAELPSIRVDTELRAGERAHLHAPRARWREPRHVSTYVDHRQTDPSSFAGESLRTFVFDAREPVSIETNTSQVLALVDVGALTVTNQRLIFAGRDRRRSVELREILAINTKDRQLWLRTKQGWRIVLELAEDADITYLLVSRMLRDHSASPGNPAATRPLGPSSRLTATR